MLNIKKAITVSGILLNNFVSLSLIIMFCWLGNLYAQMPGDFPQGRGFDPRHPFSLREGGISPSAISENVEFVGVIPIGNDIFLRRSIKNGRIVGAIIANYSLWHLEPLAAEKIKPQYAEAREHIIIYLTVKYKTAAAS